jgi:hypothetical protein
MADQWRPHGWSVEVVRLTGTPDRHVEDRTCGLKGMGTGPRWQRALTTLARTVIRSGRRKDSWGDGVFDGSVECRVGVNHLAQYGDRYPSVGRDRERTGHFAAGRPSGGGFDQYPGVGVGDQLDEPVVARAVDPAP